MAASAATGAGTPTRRRTIGSATPTQTAVQAAARSARPDGDGPRARRLKPGALTDREYRFDPGPDPAARPRNYPTGSRMRASTEDASTNASASARSPITVPQCIGTATPGSMRRAASAASEGVIT